MQQQQALSDHVARGELPGAVAAIARGDDLEVAIAGTRALRGGGAMTRDTIFRISSMTKPIVAAAALALVGDGTLPLDAPVERWLPELASRRVLRSPDGPLDDTAPARRAITVRDLLTYTAGFGMSWSAWTTPTPVVTAAEQRALGAFGPPHPQAPPPPDVWLRRFAELPLMVQPGERWQYHTSGELLGVVLARAATRPLDDVLRERILEPLGMRDTGFHVPAASLPRFATSYQVSPAGSLELYDDVGGDWAAPPAFPSGGGGLVSTLDDLLAFARMLVAGGRHAGTRVLPAALVADMTRDQLAPAQKLDGSLAPGFFAAHGWGYGVCVHTARDDAGWPAGTYGWDGGLGTSWRTDPATGTIAVLLTQAMAYPDTWPVYRQFWASAAPAPA